MSCAPLNSEIHTYDAEYVRCVRQYAEGMPIADAVEQAITECIRGGILREFLTKNRAEAKAVSIYEYNEEEHMRMEREEFFERGRLAERANTERERERADAAESRAREESSRAEEAESRAREERSRAEEAEGRAREERRRADAAKAENERLKRELEELKK